MHDVLDRNNQTFEMFLEMLRQCETHCEYWHEHDGQNFSLHDPGSAMAWRHSFRAAVIQQ